MKIVPHRLSLLPRRPPALLAIAAGTCARAQTAINDINSAFVRFRAAGEAS